MINIKITDTSKSPEEVARIVNGELGHAMREIVFEGERQVALKTPIGVTGHARQGIVSKVLSPVSGEITAQGPGERYVDFVESGRKRGKFPPSDAIKLWLRRTDKGRAFVAMIKERYNIKSDKAALIQATFLKQRGIARRGTRGAFMFKESLKAIATAAQNKFTDAIVRIEKALSDK